ncbi:radical SAM protein [bacterium]|nr:radical SAM protein [bacterium]
MKNSRKNFQEWVLAPWCKIVSGFNSAIIYDFKNRQAFRITKVAASFLLKKVTINAEVDKKGMALHRQNQITKEFSKFFDKFRKLGIIYTPDEIEDESKRFEFEIALPIPKIPLLGIIECHSYCNFQCPHCYIGKKVPGEVLEFDTVCQVLKELQKMGAETVLLTGGEICLRKDLEKIIVFAHRLGLKVEISTNGSLISKRLMKIIDQHVEKVQITLYGLSEKTYSKFSKDPRDFKKVISTIEELQTQNPEKLLVTFTLTPYNYEDIRAFTMFAEERKIEYKIGRTLPIGLALEDKILSEESGYCIFTEKFEKECYKNTMSTFRDRVCPLDRITVLSNGKVTICPLLRSSKFFFGDVYHENLEEIWYKKMRPFFPSFSVDNREICKDCEFKYLCGGGCPAIWHILEPIKQLKNPPCKSLFLTRRYIFR